MNLFKRFETYTEIHIQEIHPHFKTVDNVEHDGCTYAMDKARLNCECSEYVILDIKGDGYIKDKAGIQYPLGNIISIQWVINQDNTYKIKDTLRDRHDLYMPQIYYNEKELNELKTLSVI